jgi:hypothetical protein
MALGEKEITDEQRAAAGRALGSIRTEKKAEAARRNGFKPGHKFSPGRPARPLSEFACTCEAGEALTGHHWRCPRGQAIVRRNKEGRDPITGKTTEATA